MSAPNPTVKPLTSAQRDVVLADDVRLLVGAGAGSGKTSTVVQKLCYLLGGAVVDADGTVHRHPAPLSLNDIAAITFTNEAAADLKRKLRAALVASGLRSLATDVDSARIGTIHGFCGDLLREFSLRAGISPSLAILTQSEMDALRTDCARVTVQQAAYALHVAHFDALVEGRTIADVVALVVDASSEGDRLGAWRNHESELRDHELALLALAEEASARREGELTRLGAMDFDRMIVAVRDLLRGDARVRHAVQRQLRLLIVDEFQDVDPAQRDLAFLLGGLEFPDPAPTRIMLVGDPKQSIYRFRHADVAVWNEVADRFSDPSIGRHLELSDNFRSRKGILAFVDMSIGARLATAVNDEAGRQPFEVDYRALDAVGPDAGGDRCVELLAVNPAADGKSQSVGLLRSTEAQAVADRIRALVAEGESLGDIAILLPTLKIAHLYRDALRKVDIPAYVLRGEGFWEAREVLDCVVALRAIRDVNDDVALMGFLRGPFVGMRDDTLLALREARHPEGLRGALAAAPREPELCARALQLLGRFGSLRDRIPLHELVRRIVSETGFSAALMLDADRGAQAIANLRKLTRLCAASPELSVGEFLRDVHDTRVTGNREGEERLYRERADVVTITTVHSAKGLEWPIVFWCDLAREPVADNGKLQRGRRTFRLKLESGDVDSDGDAVDEAHEQLKRSLAEEDRAESLRRWYVASTRAKRLLVLGAVPLGSPRKADTMANELRSRFPELLAATTPAAIRYAHVDGTPFELAVRLMDAISNDSAEETLPPALPDTSTAHSQRAPSPIQVARGRTRLSASQLMTFSEEPDRWWQRYVIGFEPQDRPRSHSGGGSSAALGTVVHDVLERFNHEVTDIDELIESAIERQDPDLAELSTEHGRSYRQRVRELVDRAVEHEEWRSLASAPSARRELAFTRILDDGSVIDGALDLIALRDGVARVLDVKTGAVTTDDALARRYRVQGAVYREVVQAIANVPAEFTLLSAVNGRAVPVESGGVDVTALLASLRTGGP